MYIRIYRHILTNLYPIINIGRSRVNKAYTGKHMPFVYTLSHKKTGTSQLKAIIDPHDLFRIKVDKGPYATTLCIRKRDKVWQIIFLLLIFSAEFIEISL